jgi:hypothetical protein
MALTPDGQILSYIVFDQKLCLDEKLPICKAQEILQPECTTVHEDCRILKQRSRWVSFRSNTTYLRIK